ncbi:hypothetical protein AB6A40_002875 [Gnathostoma spinigerum]|uniref:Uncharacterized protein n=1 Tax=Gnathostoma spinigerum TaxID=75299 RepID=A0ABD6EFH4_9BILA
MHNASIGNWVTVSAGTVVSHIQIMDTRRSAKPLNLALDTPSKQSRFDPPSCIFSTLPSLILHRSVHPCRATSQTQSFSSPKCSAPSPTLIEHNLLEYISKQPCLLYSPLYSVSSIPRYHHNRCRRRLSSLSSSSSLQRGTLVGTLMEDILQASSPLAQLGWTFRHFDSVVVVSASQCPLSRSIAPPTPIAYPHRSSSAVTTTEDNNIHSYCNNIVGIRSSTTFSAVCNIICNKAEKAQRNTL